MICPVCGLALEHYYRRFTGGWHHHAGCKLIVYSAPKKSRCNECGEKLPPGTMVVGAPRGKGEQWPTFHLGGPSACEGSAWRVLHLRFGAPWEVVEAVYDALAALPTRTAEIDDALEDLRDWYSRH